MSFVYIQTEPSLWTVGVYDGDGKFQPESDHDTADEAAQRVRWLNGGRDDVSVIEALQARLTERASRIGRLSQIIDLAESTAEKADEHAPFAGPGTTYQAGYARGVEELARYLLTGHAPDRLADLIQ